MRKNRTPQVLAKMLAYMLGYRNMDRRRFRHP
jgi:hypothetical protein